MPKTAVRNNPHGANQWVADPRQQAFLAYYLDPKSPTFGNATQSGIKAKFTAEYSENIMAQMPTWLSEKIGNSPALLRAERNLEEALDLPSKTQAMGAFGPLFEKIKKKVKGKSGRAKTVIERRAVMTYNQGLLQKKIDVSMFIAETVGKAKYSKKDSGEGAIYNNVFIFGNDQRDKIAKRIIRGRSTGDTSGSGTSD